MSLTDAERQILLLAFSDERMAKYLELTGGHLADAIELHHLDALVAAELTVSLKVTELTLRNAIHTALSKASGSAYWFRDSRFKWRDRESDKLEQARKRAGRYSRSPVIAGKVVSELTLGFWVGCFARWYEHSLWHPHLKQLFPDRSVKRHHVFDGLGALFLIRNRVAHHETILPARAEGAVANVRFILSKLRPWAIPLNEPPPTLKMLESSFATIANHLGAMRALSGQLSRPTTDQ